VILAASVLVGLLVVGIDVVVCRLPHSSTAASPRVSTACSIATATSTASFRGILLRIAVPCLQAFIQSTGVHSSGVRFAAQQGGDEQLSPWGIQSCCSAHFTVSCTQLVPPMA